MRVLSLCFACRRWTGTLPEAKAEDVKGGSESMQDRHELDAGMSVAVLSYAHYFFYI